MGHDFRGTRQNADNSSSSQTFKFLGAKEIWEQTLSGLDDQAPSQGYEKWLGNIRFVAEIDKAILIAAPDQLTLDRVQTEYARPLQKSWRTYDPKQRRLKFELWSRVNSDIREMIGDPWQVEEAAAPIEPKPSLDEDNMLSFETLVSGPSNARAIGLGRRVASGGQIPSGVVVIYGQPGTGKTHILRAIEAKIAQSEDTRRVAYLSAEEFMTRFVEGARAGDTSVLQAFVKQNDLLMIDDLHWIAGKAKTDKAFFAVLRAVTSMGGHVLITADAAPGDMVGLSKELAGEIRGAAAVEVALPDEDMRRSIVRLHADLLARTTPNFIVTDLMVERIVTAIRGPGRELCGVLWSLQLETGYGEMTPTPEMLETVIRRIAGEPRMPSLDDIKRTCMELYNVTRTEIESTSKRRSVCHPRQVAMFLSRTLTNKSLPQIAHTYKKKDHTTVLHAFRKIETAIESGDRDLTLEIERVRGAIFERVSGLNAAG